LVGLGSAKLDRTAPLEKLFTFLAPMPHNAAWQSARICLVKELSQPLTVHAVRPKAKDESMRSAWTCVAVAGLACLAAACSSSDSTAPEATCDNSTVAGSYGFTTAGLNGFGVVAVTAGIANFDGQGHVTQTSTTSTNGTFTTLTKTYTYATAAASSASTAASGAAAAGCTVTMTDNGSNFANMFVVHGNAQMMGLTTAAGTNAAEEYDRIDGTCSNATLSGAYSLMETSGGFGNLFVMASGASVFDGKGNESEHVTVDRNGVFSVVDEKGTYSLNPDCTGTEIDAVAGVFGHIVAVRGGSKVLGIDMTPGTTELIDFEKDSQ
jgi:hypothetical protein